MSPVWQMRISSAAAPMPAGHRAAEARPAAARPGAPVAALALPDVRTTPAAAPRGGEVGAADLHRRRRGQVGGEHAGARDGPAVRGGDEGDIGSVVRLDARRPARGNEAFAVR